MLQRRSLEDKQQAELRLLLGLSLFMKSTENSALNFEQLCLLSLFQTV